MNMYMYMYCVFVFFRTDIWWTKLEKRNVSGNFGGVVILTFKSFVMLGERSERQTGTTQWLIPSSCPSGELTFDRFIKVKRMVGGIVSLLAHFLVKNAVWNTCFPWCVLFEVFDLPQWYHFFFSLFQVLFHISRPTSFRNQVGREVWASVWNSCEKQKTWNHCGRSKALNSTSWNARVPEWIFSWENEDNSDTDMYMLPLVHVRTLFFFFSVSSVLLFHHLSSLFLCPSLCCGCCVVVFGVCV